MIQMRTSCGVSRDEHDGLTVRRQHDRRAHGRRHDAVRRQHDVESRSERVAARAPGGPQCTAPETDRGRRRRRSVARSVSLACPKLACTCCVTPSARISRCGCTGQLTPMLVENFETFWRRDRRRLEVTDLEG